MEAWGYAAFFLVASAASFLQTSIGFGFSVFSMLFLPYFLPYADSVVLAQTIALINTIVVAVLYRRHIAWKKMLPLLLPTMIAGGAAAVLMLDIDSSYLMLALGILLIFLSASFFILSDRIHFQPNAIAGVAMGVVSGISNGFFGIGGPPIALYFAPSIPDKTEYNATVQAFFSIVNTFILAVRLARGSFSMVSPSLVLVGIIALIPSSLVAMGFFRHINADALRRIIYAFVGVNGLIIAIREIAAL